MLSILYGRAPVVYAGDYNATDVDAGVYKGALVYTFSANQQTVTK